MPKWYFAPQSHSRVSNINFDIWIFLGVVLWISHEKLPKDGNIFPGRLTELSAWVGFCISSPQQGVKYQLSYFDFFGGGGLWISDEKLPKDGNILSHLGFISRILPGPLTELSVWVGYCTSSPQHAVKYQVWYLDFFGGYKYPMKNCQTTAKFFLPWDLSQRYCPGV